MLAIDYSFYIHRAILGAEIMTLLRVFQFLENTSPHIIVVTRPIFNEVLKWSMKNKTTNSNRESSNFSQDLLELE